MGSLALRQYRRDDRTRVLELHEVAMRAVGAYVEEAPEPDLEDIHGAYSEAGGAFLVGELENDIVAMGAYRPASGYIRGYVDGLPNTSAELKRMRVDPAHQGRGYGQQVYDELERRARETGFSTIALDTTPQQEAAIHFYEKNGFERVDSVEISWDDQSITVLFYRKPLD